MKKSFLLLSLATLFSANVMANPPAASAATTAQTLELTGNSKIAAEYLDTLFNQKDFDKLQKFLDGRMYQHNPNVKDGVEPVRELINSPMAKEVTYEVGTVMEKGDLVMLHGRYSGWLGKTMLAVDIFRIENGKVIEHWDVMQEEVPAEKTASGRPMFPAK